jgi:hypothetical protein
VRVGEAGRYLVAVLALGLVTRAHADFKDSYAHGLRAFEEGDYAKARTLMQQALEEHPEPAMRLRLYGQVYKPYLPQHYLGLAAFKMGDCAAALRAWNDPANRGVLPLVDEERAAEEQARPICEKQLATSKSATPAGASVAAKPTELAADTAAAKPSLPVGQPPVAQPTVGKPPGERPVAATPNKAEPPAPLVRAFEDFLAGRYAEVARIDPDTYADAHARFHAYLVRAASRYTLSRLADDPRLLNDARADVRAARALDTRAQPDPILFSPGFRAFYSENR